MNVLHKIRKGIDLVLSWACAALFALMVIVGTYQIVVRYFFNSPSTVSEDVYKRQGAACKWRKGRGSYLQGRTCGNKRN